MLPDRFWDLIEVADCWLWQGPIVARGYGRTRVGGRKRYAHVAVYTELVGPVPTGLELDHVCRVTNCVNPDHLEPVTHAENMRRGRAGKVAAARQRAKTCCPAGHAYDAENTRVCRDGSRICRACHRLRERVRKAAAA